MDRLRYDGMKFLGLSKSYCLLSQSKSTFKKTDNDCEYYANCNLMDYHCLYLLVLKCDVHAVMNTRVHNYETKT